MTEQTDTPETTDTTVAAPVPDDTADAGSGTTEKVEQRNRRRTMRGYVVSDKMDKTIVVEVEDRKKHRLYGKVMRKSSRYKVHDETNTAGVGDLVRISETRPLSATKRFRLLEIIERAK